MEKNNTRALRDAFGSFMTGVTVVTTCKEDGVPIGFAANSFSSVSLDPALLSVCIAKTSSNYKNFIKTEHFGINILSESQRDVSNAFARSGTDKFAGIQWENSKNNNPILDKVSAWFDCQIYQVIDAGDHAILIGKIKDFYSEGYAGLGYYRGGYFDLAKVSTEVISGSKTIVAALIAHENKVLLEKSDEGKWTLPLVKVDERGANHALGKLFSNYQPQASANFIYSIYADEETQFDYISFLCYTPIAKSLKGAYVKLEDLASLEYVDPALRSMLLRYNKEYNLQSYGIYYGSATSGSVRQTN